jgi:TRAP-type C4-dicarboxylate transport system permease small subunit
MKNTAMFWVGSTTLVLVTVTIMVAMNFPFNWVFYLSLIGQVMIVFMGYRVLTDNYKTEKTFADFYEDHPIGREERYR